MYVGLATVADVEIDVKLTLISCDNKEMEVDERRREWHAQRRRVVRKW